MLRESREETVKQITKMHEEAVKEITSAHERMIETLWDAWKKEQQALRQMIASQEKSIGKLQQDIQSIQEQATRERKLMQDQIDELKRIHQTSRDPDPVRKATRGRVPKFVTISDRVRHLMSRSLIV
ncbi:hypothetical protein B0J13DRAFT_568440 [Dactylonectria estremocensis]|uniref:Uncharacterized protein n=1 Tax=Dactylonectria estremocensis TaxID=1079267 RepID=A0A9P9DJK6_9HYPO|nr:hypothetical protein B0J13DRAFT_568440 [Dactylonectria estremocensis]